MHKNTGVRRAFFHKCPSRRANPSLDGRLGNTAVSRATSWFSWFTNHSAAYETPANPHSGKVFSENAPPSRGDLPPSIGGSHLLIFQSRPKSHLKKGRCYHLSRVLFAQLSKHIAEFIHMSSFKTDLPWPEEVVLITYIAKKISFSREYAELDAITFLIVQIWQQRPCGQNPPHDGWCEGKVW